jgi:SAM-dependent methyltransferase
MTPDPHKIDDASAKNIVREGYDKLSYAYRRDDTPDDYGPYAPWVRYLEDQLPPGCPVLDIGCGCGLPATKLLSRKFKVTGVDISKVQIDRARALVPGSCFLCLDILQHDFPPETFAAIVSFTFLGRLGDGCGRAAICWLSSATQNGLERMIAI